MPENNVTTSEYTANRRSFLAAAATTAGLAVAGCTDSDTPDSEPSDPDGTPNENQGENSTPSPTPEPQIDLVRVDREAEQTQNLFGERSSREPLPLSDVTFHEDSIELNQVRGELEIQAEFTNETDENVLLGLYGWAYDEDVIIGESGSLYDYIKTIPGTSGRRYQRNFQVPLTGDYKNITSVEYVVFQEVDQT